MRGKGILIRGTVAAGLVSKFGFRFRFVKCTVHFRETGVKRKSIKMTSSHCWSCHSTPSTVINRIAAGSRSPQIAINHASKKRLRVSAVAAPAIEETMATPSHKPDVPKGLNRYSSKVTQPKSQGASQAMLYATGLTEDDMDKPQVLISLS